MNTSFSMTANDDDDSEISEQQKKILPREKVTIQPPESMESLPLQQLFRPITQNNIPSTDVYKNDPN